MSIICISVMPLQCDVADALSPTIVAPFLYTYGLMVAASGSFVKPSM